jgi:hypothetical protein
VDVSAICRRTDLAASFHSEKHVLCLEVVVSVVSIILQVHDKPKIHESQMEGSKPNLKEVLVKYNI